MLKITAIGHLGKDAELKTVNGKSVINFSVAVTENYKNKAGVKVSNTTWLECGMWEKEGVAPYLKKGTKVWIDGTPNASAYLDKLGNAAGSLRVNVFALELLDKKEADSNQGAAVAGNVSESNPYGLPF